MGWSLGFVGTPIPSQKGSRGWEAVLSVNWDQETQKGHFPGSAQVWNIDPVPPQAPGSPNYPDAMGKGSRGSGSPVPPLGTQLGHGSE